MAPLPLSYPYTTLYTSAILSLSPRARFAICSSCLSCYRSILKCICISFSFCFCKSLSNLFLSISDLPFKSSFSYSICFLYSSSNSSIGPQAISWPVLGVGFTSDFGSKSTPNKVACGNISLSARFSASTLFCLVMVFVRFSK